ncbi:amino acid ABC transporter permease [Lichenifustis flavocetrariae]|uniref:Amino acid ABC transporter permease n=1 Tax=Lichenifustis flavocetrariae TaxID=2949735 RepID=A0AA41YWS7_9HYPH|nr:amino acid ABC transporter permease [Lichenifustis flavocetrariae]MCW6510019.1 amino acid ABC transporter permease [Lichenifustis flavocetrariae]
MDLINTFFNPEVFVQSLPILLRGLGNTLLLGLVAVFFGTALGILLCLGRLYGLKPVRMLAVIYIDLFRAIPVLVVIVLIYYALPFVGVTLSSFTSASLALVLVLAAFTSEVFRAGIESIPAGQSEAAAALGLHFWQAIWKVILPQAIRVATPAQTSNIVATVKDTSLASVVAMPDLLKQATDSQALFANPTPLIGAAVIYVAILWPLVRLTAFAEARGRRLQTARQI